MEAVAAKQNFETVSIKNFVTTFRTFEEEAKADAGFAEALETVKAKVREKHAQQDAVVRRTLKPVRHLIKVEPLP
jgi:dihydroxyacetone kinase